MTDSSTAHIKKPIKFLMEATIVRWVDADTVDVQPLPYRWGIMLRVRLKDHWEPEIGEAGEDIARAKAEAAFPVSSRVVLTNDRHHWTFHRLEARVDPVVSS